MEKFHCLVDSSFNLLKASERNQAELKIAIKDLYEKSNYLEKASENIENKISREMVKSSNKSAKFIADKVLLDLNEASEKANVATEKFEKMAKFSILKVGLMFFVFFIMAGALLWFMFIKNIPTIEDIYKLRTEKSFLERDIAKMKQYGSFSSCNGQHCIQVDTSTEYGNDEDETYYIIVPKK
ncbi:conserved hypothetical protein [Vibrio crassostreae]|uniref:hypothetical protein n=1 Tax=Vibrio crassostreae TaxID=246167 RepID=UPI00104B43AE|nr:hypothetical protein [Vibrio crassostreae]TCT63750.1 hypothetical protein EDB40_101242 [Vibrio crassostreae]CAK2015943.1 conserved hypothetical protein [Vibrio crassostreae]CAK2074817.1 conserved hypothetical protein [Vibrio crassostreae]CAK2086753.1 conserved hypothetical protein [Vibrio crassostreae]CAK2144844.1 conserved hypothetical protein [Vibrio crassostreae]